VIGKALKHYAIEAKLGKGGMGEVYRARDTRLNRPVAIKILPAEVVKDPDRRRRFMMEARAASAVNHPAIAQVYEIEEEGDLVYIVMEFVDGSTVRKLAASGELDIASALEVGIQVGDALSRAHAAGIVHRDIKSDNIMVSRDGHPKILDFGLAKLTDMVSQAPGDASAMETLVKTQAGMIVGTLAYMSPEQARGLQADQRSDIFSLGVVLYEMATGRLPFGGQNALEVIHAIASTQAAPLSTIRAGLPFSLQRVIDRCLKKKPEERFQEMGELVAALRSVKKEIDTGISTTLPVMERFKVWVEDMKARGAAWPFTAGVIAGAAATFVLMGGARINVAAILGIGLGGAAIYRSFRNRGQRMIRKFSSRAANLREVRMVTFGSGQFTVVVDEPTAKTYLKLNALLTGANERLYRGEPMTMVIRDDVQDIEFKKLLTSPGVTYVRDDDKRRPSRS